MNGYVVLLLFLYLVFLVQRGVWVRCYFILGLIFDTGIILYIPDFGLSDVQNSNIRLFQASDASLIYHLLCLSYLGLL